jgi:hypothetical protein
MAEQSQDPANPDDAREAGFGPGEEGDSIEEGRQAAEDQGGDEQESADGQED